jgi:hypothetical protein
LLIFSGQIAMIGAVKFSQDLPLDFGELGLCGFANNRGVRGKAKFVMCCVHFATRFR